MSSSFRAKMKRAFGRHQGERSSESSNEKPSSRKARKQQKTEWPDNVYKPGEAMPKPKYPAPVNRAHQAKLSAFSFDEAWNRRASDQSQYSPRGSRVGSLRRRSFRPGLRSRQTSGTEVERLEESADRDDDVGNVGLSSALLSSHTARTGSGPARTTANPTTAPPAGSSIHHAGLDGSNQMGTETKPGMPFTETELTLALTRTTLRS